MSHSDEALDINCSDSELETEVPNSEVEGGVEGGEVVDHSQVQEVLQRSRANSSLNARPLAAQAASVAETASTSMEVGQGTTQMTRPVESVYEIPSRDGPISETDLDVPEFWKQLSETSVNWTPADRAIVMAVLNCANNRPRGVGVMNFAIARDVQSLREGRALGCQSAHQGENSTIIGDDLRGGLNVWMDLVDPTARVPQFDTKLVKAQFEGKTVEQRKIIPRLKIRANRQRSRVFPDSGVEGSRGKKLSSRLMLPADFESTESGSVTASTIETSDSEPTFSDGVERGIMAWGVAGDSKTYPELEGWSRGGNGVSHERSLWPAIERKTPDRVNDG